MRRLRGERLRSWGCMGGIRRSIWGGGGLRGGRRGRLIGRKGFCERVLAAAGSREYRQSHRPAASSFPRKRESSVFGTNDAGSPLSRRRRQASIILPCPLFVDTAEYWAGPD